MTAISYAIGECLGSLAHSHGGRLVRLRPSWRRDPSNSGEGRRWLPTNREDGRAAPHFSWRGRFCSFINVHPPTRTLWRTTTSPTWLCAELNRGSPTACASTVGVGLRGRIPVVPYSRSTYSPIARDGRGKLMGIDWWLRPLPASLSSVFAVRVRVSPSHPHSCLSWLGSGESGSGPSPLSLSPFSFPTVVLRDNLPLWWRQSSAPSPLSPSGLRASPPRSSAGRAR